MLCEILEPDVLEWYNNQTPYNKAEFLWNMCEDTDVNPLFFTDKKWMDFFWIQKVKTNVYVLEALGPYDEDCTKGFDKILEYISNLSDKELRKEINKLKDRISSLSKDEKINLVSLMNNMLLSEISSISKLFSYISEKFLKKDLSSLAETIAVVDFIEDTGGSPVFESNKAGKAFEKDLFNFCKNNGYLDDDFCVYMLEHCIADDYFKEEDFWKAVTKECK